MLSVDIALIVAQYLLPQKYKLLDWIDINKLNLSGNPDAVKLLKENPDKINWYCLSQNSGIFEIDVPATKLSYKNFANLLI